MSSKVLYFDNLPSSWNEERLKSFLQEHGEAEKIVLLRKRNALFAGYNPTTLETIKNNTIQALAEMSDIASASRVVLALSENPLTQDGKALGVGYSKNQELRDRTVSSKRNSQREDGTGKVNRILLVTIQNPTYPITTDLVHEIFNPYGTVQKVVIFVKPIGLQCLVQFAEVADAMNAKGALTGLSIFPDCCGLIINYSNLPQELIVKENGLRTKDFTDLNLPQTENDMAVNSCAELASPAILGYSHSMLHNTQGSMMHAAGGELISPVLLVCNLRDDATCDQLFNLFSCYGNVARIKKLSAKPDHALIQFSSPISSQSALVHLRGFTLMGRTLEISYSKHAYISIRPGSGTTQHDSPSMKEYGHGLNRFTGKYASTTKHIYSPTKILHVSNLEDSATQEGLKIYFSRIPGGEHGKIKLMRNSAGHLQALVEFSTVDMATNILSHLHNTFYLSKRLKIAFSKHSIHI